MVNHLIIQPYTSESNISNGFVTRHSNPNPNAGSERQSPITLIYFAHRPTFESSSYDSTGPD